MSKATERCRTRKKQRSGKKMSTTKASKTAELISEFPENDFRMLNSVTKCTWDRWEATLDGVTGGEPCDFEECRAVMSRFVSKYFTVKKLNFIAESRLYNKHETYDNVFLDFLEDIEFDWNLIADALTRKYFSEHDWEVE